MSMVRSRLWSERSQTGTTVRPSSSKVNCFGNGEALEQETTRLLMKLRVRCLTAGLQDVPRTSGALI